MKPSKKYTFTIAGNGVYRLQVAGDYFKILAATGLVRVRGKFGELTSLVVGQGLEEADFDDLFFTDESGASNTITVFVGDRNFIDGLTGNVGISGTVNTAVVAQKVASGAATNTQVTVTNASTTIDAANANRQYLLIQNKDATGIVYLNFGAAATVANGIQINPGGSWESGSFVPTGSVQAIGSIANNPNVVIVEA